MPAVYPKSEASRLSAQPIKAQDGQSFIKLGRIADILDVSLDQLAGRTETDPEAKIHNPELHRLYQKVDQLSDEDQKALVILLDDLVKRSRVGQIMAEV